MGTTPPHDSFDPAQGATGEGRENIETRPEEGKSDGCAFSFWSNKQPKGGDNRAAWPWSGCVCACVGVGRWVCAVKWSLRGRASNALCTTPWASYCCGNRCLLLIDVS